MMALLSLLESRGAEYFFCLVFLNDCDGYDGNVVAAWASAADLAASSRAATTAFGGRPRRFGCGAYGIWDVDGWGMYGSPGAEEGVVFSPSFSVVNAVSPALLNFLVAIEGARRLPSMLCGTVSLIFKDGRTGLGEGTGVDEERLDREADAA